LAVFILQLPAVIANQEYQHVLTLESPNPKNHALYGYQVKICGEYIILSEPCADVDDVPDAGKVYIYDTDGNLIASLQSPKPGNNNQFGESVDIHAGTIIIQETSDIDDLLFAGEAHVFDTDGKHLLTLQSPELRASGYFGVAGIYENIIVIWENREEGVAYMFDDEGAYLRTLTSPTPIAQGKFGASIEVGEKLILLGETGYEDVPRGPGRVYVFNHAGDYQFTLQAPEPEDLAMFGKSIDVSGGLIVIGEGFATVDGVWRAGHAYIFNTDGELLHILQSPNPKTGGRFGDSVAIDGDRLVVGEFVANVNPGQYEGRAYVFDVDGNLIQNLTAPNPCLRAAFGMDVDIDGDTIVVGECWAAIEGFSQAGRAHVFRPRHTVEAQVTVETTPVVEEEPEADDAGAWIPGFPVIAIVFGFLCTTIFITQMKR